MPATAVPTTKAAANHDVGAAVVVVVAARITVIAAVIICGRAVRRLRQTAPRRIPPAPLQAQPRPPSAGPPYQFQAQAFSLNSSCRYCTQKEKRGAARPRSPERAFGAGTCMNNILEKNLEPAGQRLFTRLRAVALPRVAAPLCGRAANPGTDRDKDKSPAWCTALILG
jgi:hypothetical protein